MLSFLMHEVRHIRYVNMVGCFFFVLYGILLGWKWPLIIPNLFILCTHLYFLFLRDALPGDIFPPSLLKVREGYLFDEYIIVCGHQN